ncbi:MAG TPA: O-antigen ligase family protein [Acidimicrobiales bacterium]|nr:O-antigen ligase family protein [Acidimicrobiales bacterium]
MASALQLHPAAGRHPRQRLEVTSLLALGGTGVVVVAAVLYGWEALLIAAVFAVPLVVAIRARPQRGVLILTALVPFDGLLLIVPHGQTAKSWKEALVLAILGATFVAPEEARGARGRRLPRWALPLSLFVLLALVSAIEIGGQQALTGFRIDFIYVLLAWAVWRCPLSSTERDRLVTILMAMGVITAVVGLAQQVIGPDRLNALGYQYNGAIRTTGPFLRSFSTFSDPFAFAFFLMVVVLVCLPVALSEPRRTRNRYFLLLLPVLAASLALTFVRGAWLGLAVGLAYLGWRRHRVLFVAVPFLLVAVLYLPSSVATAALSGSTLAERGSGWQANLDQVVSHPLGVGIGSSGAAGEKVASLESAGTTQRVANFEINQVFIPDNYYYKTVYELGVIGLWLFMVFLVSAFLSSRAASLRLSGRDAALSLGITAQVAAVAAASTVTTYLELFPAPVLFWLLLAVVATCDRE